MKKITEIISLFSLTIILSNCATPTRPLTPGAENVIIGVGPLPASCQLRGSVFVKENGINGYLHEKIQIKQIGILKQQAYDLGANVIDLTHHHPEYYTEFIVAYGKYIREIENHSMGGQAYYCPAGVTRQFGHPLSDVRVTEPR